MNINIALLLQKDPTAEQKLSREKIFMNFAVLEPPAKSFLHEIWVCHTRGGHSYVHCTDTRDRDQNLIGPILELDRLIPTSDHLIFTKIYLDGLIEV